MFNNKVETFDKFNKKMRRPNRKRHMELCGFTRSCCDQILDKYEGTSPKDFAKYRARSFNEMYRKPVHIVYFQGSSNMDGDRGYQFWEKEI